MPHEMSIYIDYEKNVDIYGMYLGEDGHEGVKQILDESGFFELGPKGGQSFLYYSSEDLLEARAWMDNGLRHYGNATDYRVYNTPTSFVFKRLDLPPHPNAVHPTWAQIQNDSRVNVTHPYGTVGTIGPISNLDPLLRNHEYHRVGGQV